MSYIINDSGRTTGISVARRLVDSSIPCDRIDIQASLSNAGVVYVGGPSVSSTTGIALNPGDVYNLELVTDALNVWVLGSGSDSVTWNWWRGSNV